MNHFCLLKHPEAYVAHDWDLIADEASRLYWLDHFQGHFAQTLKFASTQYGRTAGKAVALAGAKFKAAIEALRADPAALGGGRLSVLELCRLRDSILREHKLSDPFKHVKQRENLSAARLYPRVVRPLHAMEGPDKWLHLVRSIFAGNIFDLGSASTMHLAGQPTDFLTALGNLKPRPWLVDDYDRLAADLPHAPPTKWSKVVIFIDNAGSDFILGVMPLARELALYGTKVVLAANELASLNDMTVNETVEEVEKLARADEDLAALLQAGMFEVVSSGNTTPLIDLSQVSDELNEAAADAELVILEGMGRGIESNFDAQFTTDSLNIALLKDAVVAKRVGGELFDCVCRYAPVQ